MGDVRRGMGGSSFVVENWSKTQVPRLILRTLLSNKPLRQS